MIAYSNSPDKPVRRYKFYAHDLTNDPKSTEEVEWTVSPTVASGLIRWIKKAAFC